MGYFSMPLGAAGVVAALATLSGPAAAAPFFASPLSASSPALVEVQDRRGPRMGDERRGRWGDRGRFERRGGGYFYNGHRGFRDHRHGYRRYNGWWFPPAAFGLMIETRPALRVRPGGAHVRWCYDRWRSYRAWDNSYQPNSGPRRQCVSPYS